jgi:hypothetical protein
MCVRGKEKGQKTIHSDKETRRGKGIGLGFGFIFGFGLRYVHGTNYTQHTHTQDAYVTS